MWSRTRAAAAVAVVTVVGTALTGCTGASTPSAHVVVRIEAKDRAQYDVRLAAADGGFRTASRMHPGESRTFAVPAGWLTVRVPGLCVVPTATTGTTTVEVGPDRCAVA